MKKFINQGDKDTRSGFGEGLTELGRNNKEVVALCADLTGSLKMNTFANENPERFFQVGIAEANKLSNKKDNVIAVIGDGAISAGMAYEAMNNAGASKTKMIVILNDNDMSIARPVGAMSTYLARIFS